MLSEPPASQRIEFSYGTGRTKLQVTVDCLGQHLLICLLGGDAHIGGVVMAEPRPSLTDPSQVRATSSILNRLGHLDEELLRPMAETLASEKKTVVVVCGGCHIADATPTELEEILDNANQLTKKMIYALSNASKWER